MKIRNKNLILCSVFHFKRNYLGCFDSERHLLKDVTVGGGRLRKVVSRMGPKVGVVSQQTVVSSGRYNQGIPEGLGLPSLTHFHLFGSQWYLS